MPWVGSSSKISSGSKTGKGKAGGTPAGPVRRKVLDVVADRFRLGGAEQARVVDAIEAALKRGGGRINVYALGDGGAPDRIWKFSTGLHCPESDLRYTDPIASAFSFNSAVGACESCRGFGRVIGVDYGLVIPNEKLTLRAGAIKPMQREFRSTRRGTNSAQNTGAGSSTARPTGMASGTSTGSASSGFSSTWRPRLTRCISGYCCPSTGVIRRAPLALVPGSRPRACCGALAAQPMPMR